MVIVLMFIPNSPERRLWSPIFSSVFYGLLLTDHALHHKHEKILSFRILVMYHSNHHAIFINSPSANFPLLKSSI